MRRLRGRSGPGWIGAGRVESLFSRSLSQKRERTGSGCSELRGASVWRAPGCLRWLQEVWVTALEDGHASIASGAVLCTAACVGHTVSRGAGSVPLLAWPVSAGQERPCRVPLTVSAPALLPGPGGKGAHAERAGRSRFAGAADVPGLPGRDGAAAGAADGGGGGGAVR